MVTHAGKENEHQFNILAVRHPRFARWALKFLLEAKKRGKWNNGKRWKHQATTSTRILGESGLVIFRMATRRRRFLPAYLRPRFPDERWTVILRADTGRTPHTRLKPHEGWDQTPEELEALADELLSFRQRLRDETRRPPLRQEEETREWEISVL